MSSLDGHRMAIVLFICDTVYKNNKVINYQWINHIGGSDKEVAYCLLLSSIW